MVILAIEEPWLYVLGLIDSPNFVVLDGDVAVYVKSEPIWVDSALSENACIVITFDLVLTLNDAITAATTCDQRADTVPATEFKTLTYCG